MIDLTLQETGRPLNSFWRFGANTCHAALWLRDDLVRQIAMARSELGFRYIRCHGFLNQDLVTANDDGSFDFERLFTAIGRVLDVGAKPFVELSTMPECMCREDKHIAAYRFMSSPPADWDRWYTLIRDLVHGLAERFGLEEMRRWYFEVWNEPDIAFWNGTQAEYFKLYDLAARAVKEFDPQLRIGGPATSKTAWIPEFCAHVSKPSADFGLEMPRCDFVSTHAYPSDVEFLDCDRGDVTLVNSNIMRELFVAARSAVDETLGPDMPLICGEWNSSAGPLARNHDECNNAAYIAKTMIELRDFCQGSLYWDLSDIYEECHFHYEPFHGGYGLFTVNDIQKSSFHSFRLLGEHDGEEIDVRSSATAPGFACLASRQGGTTRILLTHYQEPDEPDADALTVKLSGLESSRGSAKLELIRPGQGSAYETWQDLGEPMYLNHATLHALEDAAKPALCYIDPTDEITLPPGTIAQLTLEEAPLC